MERLKEILTMRPAIRLAASRPNGALRAGGTRRYPWEAAALQSVAGADTERDRELAALVPILAMGRRKG